MQNTIDSILAEFRNRWSDSRIHVFDVQIKAGEGRAELSGEVLEAAQLNELRATLGAQADAGAVRVLRQSDAPLWSVTTNLTSLHAGRSFISEQISQMLNGAQVEILKQEGNWVYVRQTDGYLGWTYLPYLEQVERFEAGHLVISPVSVLLAEPEQDAGRLTRVLGGTELHVARAKHEWGEVILAGGLTGWLPLTDLRSRVHLPSSQAQRREQIVQDGLRMTGVPYLWGGVSANGIDCSGLAQLLHRWVGFTLPRDADMQCAAGKPIEPPFQPGDLLFFGEQGERRNITHVAISMGGWNIIHSSRSRNGVHTDNVQEVKGLRESFLQAATYLAE